METLQGKKIENFQLKNSLSRIVDLINIDGPILSLFKGKNFNELYLFDWVDRNNLFNRWLIYRCNAEILNKFVDGQISHYDLFVNSENISYVVDIDYNITWNNIIEISKKDLSKNYFPSQEIFFDKLDCSNYPKLLEFLTKFQQLKQKNSDVKFLTSYLCFGNLLSDSFSSHTKIAKKLPVKSNEVPTNLFYSFSL